MKKVLLHNLLFVVLLSPIFAETYTYNYNVQGIAVSSEYILSLYYGNNDISNQSGYDLSDIDWRIDDPNILNTTDVFTIFAESGNVQEDNTLEVIIEPSVFVGTFIDNSTYITSIVPSITPTSDSVGVFSDDNTTITNTLPSGYISESLELAKFRLSWSGDATLPAGEYKSTITITYKLE